MPYEKGEKKKLKGKKVLTEYKGDDSKVVIPSGVQVVDGFKDNKAIKELIPSSVAVNENAFGN